jgi:hypothetical protein
MFRFAGVLLAATLALTSAASAEWRGSDHDYRSRDYDRRDYDRRGYEYGRDWRQPGPVVLVAPIVPIPFIQLLSHMLAPPIPVAVEIRRPYPGHDDRPGGDARSVQGAPGQPGGPNPQAYPH